MVISVFTWNTLLRNAGKKKTDKLNPKSGIRVVSKINKKSNEIVATVSAMVSPGETASKYADLLSYLSRKINKPILVLQGKDYQSTNKLLNEGRVDLAILCTGNYFFVKDSVEILVSPVFRGKPYYYSYIIVNKKKEYRNLEDLKGKTFAFTDPFSLSGHIYPGSILKLKGYNEETFFRKIIFTYNHDNSIRLVNEGLVDGAAVDSLIYEYLFKENPDAVENIKVIHTSPPLPSPPVVISKKMDHKTKEKLLSTFLLMDKDKEGSQILRALAIDSFVESNNSFYEEHLRDYHFYIKELPKRVRLNEKN